MTNPSPITADQFRLDFHEFSSSVTYPDTMIDFWLTVAANFVRQCVWGNQYGLGCELYAAHNLVLEAQAQRASQTGGIPGVATGPINSKSVDKVSVGYDTGVASEEGAGNWNLTTYGLRFKRLADLFGMGGIQLGVCSPGWPYGGFTFNV